MRMTGHDWGLLFLLSVLWGGSFFFAAVAVRDIPPLSLVILRTGIAALVLWLILVLRQEVWRPVVPVVLAFLTMGALNNLIPFSLLFWAQTVIPSGLASILNATTPIFSIVVAHVLLADERMAAHKALGIALGFIGVAILVGGDVIDGAGFAVLGMAACLGAALSYGIATVFGRRFKGTGLSVVQVAFGQLVATSVMMIPIVGLIDRPWTLALPGVWAMASVIALAVLSTALAYVLYFRVLASAGAVNVALVTLLVPVSAILLGRLVLGEVLVARQYIGMGCIALGLLAIDGRVLDRLRTPVP